MRSIHYQNKKISMCIYNNVRFYIYSHQDLIIKQGCHINKLTCGNVCRLNLDKCEFIELYPCNSCGVMVISLEQLLEQSHNQIIFYKVNDDAVLNAGAIYVYQYLFHISNATLATMASIAITCTGLIILFNLCRPFNVARGILLLTMTALALSIIIFMPNLLSYVELSTTQLLFTIIIVETSYPVYCLLSKAFDSIKRINPEDPQ